MLLKVGLLRLSLTPSFGWLWAGGAGRTVSTILCSCGIENENR